MDTKQTIRLLRIAYSLLKDSNNEFSISESAGRDLFDFAIEFTQDQNIKYQDLSARESGYDRLTAIRYLNYRLNLEL